MAKHHRPAGNCPQCHQHDVRFLVTLSDGRVGKVYVVLKVDTLLPCGLPQHFERIVTTELSGVRMVSREVFAFSAP